MPFNQQLDRPELLGELFKKLFNNSTDSLFIADKDLKIEIVNSAFTELFNISDEQINGVDLSSLFVKESRYAEVMDNLHETHKLQEEEVILTDNRDDVIHCLLSLIPLTDNNDSLIGYQGIVHDITARINAQRKLGRAEKVALTGRMARTIAHEIRNPLTNISLAMANLDTDQIAEEDRFLLDIIENNVDRINDLLTELLDSARPADLHRETIDVAQLLQDTLELSSDRMDLQCIELELDIADPEIQIQGDVVKLKLALNNIIINAIEAMSSGGKVTVRAKKLPKRTIIQIEDTGSGIPTEELRNLFDPFYTNKPGGTGLGLTTVQNIIENHGWEIEAESEFGKGTYFTISIS